MDIPSAKTGQQLHIIILLLLLLLLPVLLLLRYYCYYINGITIIVHL